MATGMLVILDDIAAIFDDMAIIMDDVVVMGKVATKKTAGILGDDLAVGAEKATGFNPARELPVIWAIAKGSFLNKVIILPLAFLLSAYLNWLIVPILLLGGTYLCFEAAEKVHEWISAKKHVNEPPAKTVEDKDEILRLESSKIKSAIFTDFILSIEIIIIALSTVMDKPMLTQVFVVSFIALAATVGVYGIVALLVRMDDVGIFLINYSSSKEGAIASSIKKFGKGLIISLPWLIQILGVIGTIAMLLVGGGMFTHHVGFIHDIVSVIPSLLADVIVGLIVGGPVYFVSHLFHEKWNARKGVENA